MATTPRQVYNALTRAGASTTQAIGIMANALNESAFNPEAVGDQGTSFGIVQQHGTQYAGLVTGNPGKDLTNQVKVIAQNGGFRAASGSTPGEAAGNFAAQYERCVGCQAGGAQYNQRVANAAVVAGWVRSGKWPASVVNPGAGSGLSGSLPAGDGGGAGNDCAFGPKLPVVGQVCLVKRATIRHIIGGGLMVGGFLVLLPGLGLVLVYGFRSSGVLQSAANVAAVVPGGGRAAERLTGAQSRVTRTGASVTRERAQGRARQQTEARRTVARIDRAEAAERRRRDRAAARRYTVTEREPLGGQMGGTRTVRYQTSTRPARADAE